MTSDKATTYFEDAQALENAADLAIAHTKTVLDIGCGIRPMTRFQPEVHLCLEPFEPYTAMLQTRFAREPGTVVLKAGALEGLAMFGERSVDSIFLLDVIEHMPKAYGFSVLRQCDRVARRQIVIATPLGFMPQVHAEGEKDGWGVTYNKLQDHLSGWVPEDFGDGWRFLVCRAYHAIDSKGRQLKKTFGSFYAIRDIGPMLNIPRARPVLIGATVPPAQVNGKVREEILAIFKGFDESQLQIFSSYDARPYSPNYNIPDLLAFSTKRLDGRYHHIRYPAGWTDMVVAPPSLDTLPAEFASFLAPLVEVCRSGGHDPVMLFDFGPAELLLAYYLAASTGTRTLFLSSPSHPLVSVSALFEHLPHARLDLADGIDAVRSTVFGEPPFTRSSQSRSSGDAAHATGAMPHLKGLQRLRNFIRRLGTTD